METIEGFLTGLGLVLTRIWAEAVSASSPPPRSTVLACLGVALAVVVIAPAWRIARHLVTTAHEGAHGVAALLTGRRLAGIRLHSDTSGLTVSRGRPTGPGMMLTAFAGYVGPGLIGLGSAALLAHGYAMGALWLLVALLALLLLQIRNGFGLWSVGISAVLLAVVSWYAPADVRIGVACAVTWFLLLGAVRPVIELQAQRSRGRARDSDADQLARLTHLPGLLWVGVFLVVTVGSAALGGSWLLAAGA